MLGNKLRDKLRHKCFGLYWPHLPYPFKLMSLRFILRIDQK